MALWARGSVAALLFPWAGWGYDSARLLVHERIDHRSVSHWPQLAQAQLAAPAVLLSLSSIAAGKLPWKERKKELASDRWGRHGSDATYVLSFSLCLSLSLAEIVSQGKEKEDDESAETTSSVHA